jgi:biotin synthase-related radical SAM superfamily protein
MFIDNLSVEPIAVYYISREAEPFPYEIYRKMCTVSYMIQNAVKG